jgi:hypothetical protein
MSELVDCPFCSLPMFEIPKPHYGIAYFCGSETCIAENYEFGKPLIDAIKNRQPEPGQPAAALGCDYQGIHFGAIYEDATCIDGYLWDLDSCDEPGSALTHGGDIPCPKCNAKEYADYFNDGEQPAAGQGEPVAEQQLLSDMNAALCDFYKRWIPDGDYLRCKKCKRAHIASHADEKFIHKAFCNAISTSEDYPWQVLIRLLRPLYTHPIPAAPAVPDIDSSLLPEWWRVEISDHTGQVVSIEPGMLAGREIGEIEEAIIRNCIEHLDGFLGHRFKDFFAASPNQQGGAEQTNATIGAQGSGKV